MIRIMARKKSKPATGAAKIIALRCSKLSRKLSKKEAGRLFIEAVCWPDGKPVCPCGTSSGITRLKRAGLFRCNRCLRDFSVRAGTIFHASNVGLHHWAWAICMVAEEGGELTSVRLGRVLGVTQKTAWTMMERIRGPRRVYLHYLLGAPKPGGRGIRKSHHERAKRMRAFARKRSLARFRRLITHCG